MNISDGLVVEKNIARSLNEKTYGNLSNNLKHLVKKLFPDVLDEDVITSDSYEDIFKADIYIECCGITKNVSIKTGRSEIVHNEILDKFCSYLKENGITDKTIETIRLFHYGDTTTDGTGKRRMNYNEIMTMYKERIAEANYELNTDREFVKNTVNRLVFDGASNEYTKADAIYVGDLEFGVIASKTQVEKHIKRKYYSYYNNLHIGPILLRPDCRYVDTEIRDERKRNRIVAYWPSLRSDVEYIANRYNN